MQSPIPPVPERRPLPAPTTATTNPAALWPRLVAPLVQYLLGDPAKLAVFRSILPEHAPLLTWVPDRAETAAIKAAVGAVDRVKAPGFAPKPGDYAAIVAAFDHPAAHWRHLRDLAVAHLQALGHGPALAAALEAPAGPLAKPPDKAKGKKKKPANPPGATWSPPPPACREAWGRLLPAWIAASTSGNLQALMAIEQNYRAKGWTGCLPTSWRPSKAETNILKGLETLRKRILAVPAARKPGFIAQMVGEMRLLRSQAANCLMLARGYFGARGIDLDQAPKLALPSAAPAPAAPTPGKQRRRRRKQPAQPSAPVTRHAPPPTPEPFRLTAQEICVFIDEVEPHSDRGAIAGIVWDGPPATVPGPELPRINTHRRNAEPLATLLGCGRAFPFIVPVNVQEGTRADYLTMVRTTIQILLGWLLPRPAAPTRVAIFLERFGGYPEGTDQTAFFAGALDEATVDDPARFGPWTITQVTWQDKPFGYIPWGDLLGYWYLQQVVLGESFGQHDCTALPGYLPIDETGYRTIREVCRRPTPGGILDLAGSLGDSHLARAITRDLRTRCCDDHRLTEGLLVELDRRYHLDQRDLRQLRPQLQAVRTLLEGVDDSAPLRVRLLLLALDLQDANHDGDPARAAGLEERYRALRTTALDLDHNLVAHIDANLAVHASDRGDFAHACEILEWLSEDPRFTYLRPISRGRHLSSLGQQLSIAGCHAEADDRFGEALALIDRDPGLSDQQRARERSQTLTYRTINALDGGLPTGLALLRELLGGAPLAQVEALTCADDTESLARQYHHHVLLRQAWFADDAELSAAIVEREAHWSRLRGQHPWELIGLYRALLIWREGPEDRDVAPLFTKALTVIEAAGGGAALTMIGSAIALAGATCTDDPALLAQGRAGLEAVTTRLGANHPIATELRAGLAALEALPEEIDEDALIDLVNDLLGALPFNYR